MKEAAWKLTEFLRVIAIGCIPSGNSSWCHCKGVSARLKNFLVNDGNTTPPVLTCPFYIATVFA
jgi:hypothetical protein